MASFRKTDVTTPTFIPRSRATSATVGSFFIPEGSMPRTPLFVLNPVASAVPAAAESVTAAFADRVEIFPRTASPRSASRSFPAATLYNSAASTCASPIPSPMKRKTYFARSLPPKAAAAKRSRKSRISPIVRKKRFISCSSNDD